MTGDAARDIPADPSSCGIVVERGDPGVLQGDLDCSGRLVNAAIVLNPGATLNLDGHRLTNDTHGVVCRASVSPSRTCTIAGPGEITGAANGLAAESKARVVDVVLHGNETGIWKIYGDLPHAARLDLESVEIRDNSGPGIRGGGAIRATDTAIRDNGGAGMTSYGPSRLVRSTISGNGGAGVVTGVFSDFYGTYTYSGRKLFLVDSDVSGNGALDGAADLAAASKPNLRRSSCGTSADPTRPGSPSWGVCAGD